MPTPPDTPELLRERARGLRALSRQIGSLRAASLTTLSGTDTWMGPSPDRCAADLRLLCIELAGGADRLLGAARRLERRATDLTAVNDPARAH
jgi:hypothetical protein